MKESIAKDKMKFIMKCKMVFLETKIVATPITGKSFVITTSMYSKKRHSYQHLNPKSYHTKNQIKNTPIVVANRIRRNCSDNIINDVTYKKRLIEYKAYLMKSGHSENDTDNSFCQGTIIPRRKTLRNKSNRKYDNKIKFIYLNMNHPYVIISDYGERTTTF